MNALELLKKHLGLNPQLLHTVLVHSQHVAQRVMQIAEKNPQLMLDETFLQEAALIHDIGVYMTYAPEIHCYGSKSYICHGYLGKELIEQEGFPKHALVCERHTGTGLYINEIIERKLPLPLRDLAPISLEEQVICYADKFFSKSNLGKTFTVDDVRANLSKYGQKGVDRFNYWVDLFE